MRADAIGFFWEDLPPPPKVKKEKIKRTPPPRTWEAPDYLPGIDEARRAVYNLFTADELIIAQRNKEELVFDIECYPNYFLIAFQSVQSLKIIYFEMYYGCQLATDWLNWIVHNFTLISYNGLGYDEPILTLALAGYDNAELKRASDQIIVEDWRSYEIIKSRKLKRLKLDHIDVMEVAPGGGSLKQRAGRLHCRRLQDLPFNPSSLLNHDQMLIVRHYCVNDLDVTYHLYLKLEKPIALRKLMSKDYGIDLRSRSDAQIAEDVISHEMKIVTRQKYLPKAKVEPGRRYKYNIPKFVQFQTPLMRSVLKVLPDCDFVIGDNGAVQSPWQMEQLLVQIGENKFQMGIGGLHSTESAAFHPLVKGRCKRDIDVTSYYPSVILGQRLYPEHLGPQFLVVYKKIVDRRIKAKRDHDDDTAQTLKIVINGSFGKLGSMWSVLYAPQLLIQTTITGQLALLMLIEAFELEGIKCLSANTDGIVIDYDEKDEEKVNQMIKWWENQTNFEMESNYYKVLASANVNNYVAVTNEGKIKSKGWFADTGLQKNPTGEIVNECLRAVLKDGVNVEEYIRNCKDIKKFITVRAVKGGAVCNGEFLGKVVRWYTGPEESPEIIYALSGNKVAGSTGGVPLMELSDKLPEDLNYDAYINRVHKYLEMVGYQ